MTKSERGILSEWQVANDRIGRLHEALVVHRKRTPFAEVDLLFCSSRSPRSLVLVEVKSLAKARDLWGADLISKRQLQRLKSARVHLSIHYRLPVQLVIAVVRPTGAIDYFDIDNES